MANQLTVHEHNTISDLTAKGWAIRRIARELKLSRNTVRLHVRAGSPPDPGPVVEANITLEHLAAQFEAK